MQNNTSGLSRGFTIVELLIVIVVIAILAAISIVAYNGIQARANNAKTLTAVDATEKALQLWHIDTGAQPYSGASSTGVMPASPTSEACPGATSTGGWAGSGTGYQCSLEDLLVAYKRVPSTLFSSLPPNKIASGNSPKRTIMFYGCSGAINTYILMWYMDAASSNDMTNFDKAWQKCTGNPAATASTTIYYTAYGMRNGRFITLN